MGGAKGKVAYIGTASHISTPDGTWLIFHAIQTLKGPSDPRGTPFLLLFTQGSLPMITG